MFSKQTVDRVKLAKQYIQNRYQSMINQDQRNKSNWNKIIQIIDPSSKDMGQIVESVAKNQMMNKRLQRTKDNLCNYKLYNVIGRGAFGEVRLARNLIDDQIVAIKRLQKKNILQKKQIYNTYLERDLMVKNNCQFVVQVKSTFQDEDYLYFAMEYVQGGDLLHLLIDRDKLSEEQTKFYVAEMVLAVEQIHKTNYIHRDIKPDNILIDKTGHIKVSDFGLSKFLEYEGKSSRKNGSGRMSKMEKLKKLIQIKNKQKSYSKVGTPDYISPEVLIEKTYDHSVDIWGIGVIMFQCLFGYPPFTDESSKEVCHKVANWVDYLEFPTDVQVSTQAKMFILGLVNESQRRLTIKEIKRHPYFQGFDWENIKKMKPPFIPKVKDEVDVSNFDEFQLQNPWTQKEKHLIYKFNKKSIRQSLSEHHKKDDSNDMQLEAQSRRVTVGHKFNFAGFEYRKMNEDPLEVVAMNLQRKSCEYKSVKKMSKGRVGSVKYLKTEQHYSGQKKPMRPKILLGKMKSNQHLHKSKTNITNSSFNSIKVPTSKQLLWMKEDVMEKSKRQQKENRNVKKNAQHSNEQQQNSFMRKGLIKTKTQKIKQAYGAESQKGKLKKLVTTQSQFKNI